MSGHRFEREFGRLLEIDGYKVKYTKGSGDGGIDLIAKKASEEIIIQCKAWKNPVGPAPIREMQGVKEGNQKVWVVGLGGFTKGAEEFAKQKGIRLLEYKDVNLLVQKSNR
jgi:restriction system protein